MNILGAHIDSPRLDLKQNPLYEDGEMALLDTHYYGGIKMCIRDSISSCPIMRAHIFRFMTVSGRDHIDRDPVLLHLLS